MKIEQDNGGKVFGTARGESQFIPFLLTVVFDRAMVLVIPCLSMSSSKTFTGNPLSERLAEQKREVQSPQLQALTLRE